jgi:carboxypeptidase T
MPRAALLLCVVIALLTAGSLQAVTFQSVGLYQSFNDLESWASSFAAANPDLVHEVQYGTAYQTIDDQGNQRPLIALQISESPGVNNPAKPEFLFTGGIHAREVVGSQAAYTLADQLVAQYRAGDPVVRDMLATREVWVVPDLNPDGRVRVEGGYNQQRKNMHFYPPDQIDHTYTEGVDLNRNFPHSWSSADKRPYSETYRGPSVLSEPESSSLWSLLHNPTWFSDLRASIDFHSGAETILTPWTSPSEFANNPLPAADRAKFDFLAGRIQQVTGFSTDRLDYNSYGTLADSLYEEFGTYSMLEEIYVGPWSSPYDYFAYFNPVDQPTIDDRVNKAVASAMFLLSDEAFAVPEPSTVLLLAVGGGVLFLGNARCRHFAFCILHSTICILR